MTIKTTGNGTPELIASAPRPSLKDTLDGTDADPTAD
jgi:hypothetical protein